MEYEDSLHELLSQCSAGFESVDDFPWIEIDFEEDIERARREILPKIRTMQIEVEKKIDQPVISHSDSPIIDRYIIRKISGFISGLLVKTPSHAKPGNYHKPGNWHCRGSLLFPWSAYMYHNSRCVLFYFNCV